MTGVLAGGRASNHTPDPTRKRAVTYLRVSSLGQVNTDYDTEGISLPAQRRAVERRAAELGPTVLQSNERSGSDNSMRAVGVTGRTASRVWPTVGRPVCTQWSVRVCHFSAHHTTLPPVFGQR